MIKFILILCSLATFASASANENLKQELFEAASKGHRSFNYRDARVKLFNEIYLEKDTQGYYVMGVYCQDKYYPFNGQAPGTRLPDPVDFNTEHSWPQSKFSNRFSKNVQKSDLHHLFPTYSRINSERANLPFAEVDAQRDLSCDDSHLGRALSTGRGNYFEPPTEHKGNLARALFYFSIRYQMEIDPVQEEYLKRWHHQDPVDEMEKSRHEKIFKLQNNRNPFIDDPELVEQIADF